MWPNEEERIRGYEYPPPSIEGGSTQSPTTPPKVLSPENVRRIRDTVRRSIVEKPTNAKSCE